MRSHRPNFRRMRLPVSVSQTDPTLICSPCISVELSSFPDRSNDKSSDLLVMKINQDKPDRHVAISNDNK